MRDTPHKAVPCGTCTELGCAQHKAAYSVKLWQGKHQGSGALRTGQPNISGNTALQFQVWLLNSPWFPDMDQVIWPSEMDSSIHLLSLHIQAQPRRTSSFLSRPDSHPALVSRPLCPPQFSVGTNRSTRQSPLVPTAWGSAQAQLASDSSCPQSETKFPHAAWRSRLSLLTCFWKSAHAPLPPLCPWQSGCPVW